MSTTQRATGVKRTDKGFARNRMEQLRKYFNMLLSDSKITPDFLSWLGHRGFDQPKAIDVMISRSFDQAFESLQKAEDLVFYSSPTTGCAQFVVNKMGIKYKGPQFATGYLAKTEVVCEGLFKEMSEQAKAKVAKWEASFGSTADEGSYPKMEQFIEKNEEACNKCKDVIKAAIDENKDGKAGLKGLKNLQKNEKKLMKSKLKCYTHFMKRFHLMLNMQVPDLLKGAGALVEGEFNQATFSEFQTSLEKFKMEMSEMMKIEYSAILESAKVMPDYVGLGADLKNAAMSSNVLMELIGNSINLQVYSTVIGSFIKAKKDIANYPELGKKLKKKSQVSDEQLLQKAIAMARMNINNALWRCKRDISFGIWFNIYLIRKTYENGRIPLNDLYRILQLFRKQLTAVQQTLDGVFEQVANLFYSKMEDLSRGNVNLDSQLKQAWTEGTSSLPSKLDLACKGSFIEFSSDLICSSLVDLFLKESDGKITFDIDPAVMDLFGGNQRCAEEGFKRVLMEWNTPLIEEWFSAVEKSNATVLSEMKVNKPAASPAAASTPQDTPSGKKTSSSSSSSSSDSTSSGSDSGSDSTTGTTSS